MSVGVGSSGVGVISTGVGVCSSGVMVGVTISVPVGSVSTDVDFPRSDYLRIRLHPHSEVPAR